MKRNILILLALAQAALIRAQIIVMTPVDYEPGLPVDTVQYSVGYDFAFVNDAAKHPYKPLHEQMTLNIGARSASFFSHARQQCDSIAADAIRRGINQYKLTSQITWNMYTDYPSAGQYSYLERFGMDRFVMVDKRPEPAWTLCEDSLKTVLGYPCRKATATVLGREWTAWYTDDIPLDNGPWLLSGLPGLILQAETADSCFRFEANGLAKGTGTQPINYHGEKYERLDRKTLASVYRRYNADPVGYLTNNQNVKVIRKDRNGNTITTRMTSPYNLMDKNLCEEKR